MNEFRPKCLLGELKFSKKKNGKGDKVKESPSQKSIIQNDSQIRLQHHFSDKHSYEIAAYLSDKTLMKILIGYLGIT